MVPKLKVSQKILDRLSTINKPCIGKLYGILYKDSLLIITLQLNTENNCDLVNNFPAEVDLCGAFEVGDGNVENDVTNLIHDVDVTDTPIYMSCKLGHTEQVTFYYSINDRLENATYDIMLEKEIISQFIHVHVLSQLPLISCFNPEAINDSFQLLRKQLAQGQVAFNVLDTNTFILGNEDDLIGIAGEPKVIELCGQFANGEGGKKKKTNSMNTLAVTMFKKVTKDVGSEGPKLHSPVLHVEKKCQKNVILTIRISALSIVHKDVKVAELYPILVESCCRYLRLYQTELIKQCDDNHLMELETFHFYSEECGHFLTKIYPKEASEQTLENERKQLHIQLNLPLTKPIFKRGNQFVFMSNAQDNSPLINPHENLPNVGNGEVAIVRGKYQYFHYMQNNVDDNGWGCAYRSLQTLASWLILQGYTDKSVPTIEEIQKCLIRIGDKPAELLGSKQWIGSTEVSMVISTLFDILCKIKHLSSGTEMDSVGPDLLNHFRYHGSPIMIGGGSYAHTILGVDYNQETNDIKFLILDPHYTGCEDLQLIQKKGWCGWKGLDFWNKKSFYNMCMPQIPNCF